MGDISHQTRNIHTKTMSNGSDNFVSVQLAESHALCVFINTVSMIWIILFIWSIFIILWLLDYCIWRKVGPEKAKTESYRHFLRAQKSVIQVWSVINFIILWTNLSFIIYCYTRHDSCVLYHEDDNSITNAAAMLIVAAACTYVAQFIEGGLHFRQHNRTTDVLLTSLQEKITHLIKVEKPIVKWTVTRSHASDDDPVSKNAEEKQLEYKRWETSGVWVETLCGYKELSHEADGKDDLPTQDATRIKITVQICAGDQETTSKWLEQRNTFQETHRQGLRDPYSTFAEERHTSRHYFRDTTVSAKKAYISIGYIVSTVLGLGPPFRLRLHMIVPERHYIIEKCVYSSENESVRE